jgi:hypothetical protein
VKIISGVFLSGRFKKNVLLVAKPFRHRHKAEVRGLKLDLPQPGL